MRISHPFPLSRNEKNISFTICFPYGKNPYSRRISDMITAMDILADYREWKAEQEERIGTHSKRCHLWPRHERCMIHRLAAELEKSRKYRDLLEADLSIAMLTATRNGNLSACETVRLTDKEREAVEAAARIIDAYEEELDGFPSGASATLRSLLERTLTTHTKPAEGSVQDSDT